MNSVDYINCYFYLVGLALDRFNDKDGSKRHTMSHPPDHIPELDSPRQSRSPLKKDKKEQVRKRPSSIQIEQMP